VKLPVLNKPGSAKPKSSGTSGSPTASVHQAELAGQRDRLTERFALVMRAAELQKVDMELAQVEHLLAQSGATYGGNCPSCQTAYAKGAAFCSQCASPLPQS
jgi:hypothetical protein